MVKKDGILRHRFETKAMILAILIRNKAYDEESSLTRLELLDQFNNTPGVRKIGLRALDVHLTGKWGEKEKSLNRLRLTKSSQKGLYLKRPENIEEMTDLLETLTNLWEMNAGERSNIGMFLKFNLNVLYKNCENSYFGKGPLFDSSFNLYEKTTDKEPIEDDPKIRELQWKILENDLKIEEYNENLRLNRVPIKKKIAYVLAVTHIEKIIRTKMCNKSSRELTQIKDPECSLGNLTLALSYEETIYNRAEFIFRNEKDIVNNFFNESIEKPIVNHWDWRLFPYGEELIEDVCDDIIGGIMKKMTLIEKILKSVPLSMDLWEQLGFTTIGDSKAKATTDIITIPDELKIPPDQRSVKTDYKSEKRI